MNDSLDQRVRHFHAESLSALKALGQVADQVVGVAGTVKRCLARGGTVFACGNGGSAADAQHFVAELVGRFELSRPGRRAVALTVDTSVLTAVGNDFGFDQVFARQVAALGRAGDMLIGISTSGTSPNVLAALETAQARGMEPLLLTGKDAPDWGGAMLAVPARRTAVIQQLHITVLHMLCLAVDSPEPEA